MFQLYKDLKVLYFVIGFSVAIPLAIFGAWVEKIGFIILGIAFTFVLAIIIELIAQKRFNNLNKIRETNCNITEYYNGLIELRSKCKNPKLLNNLNMNIAVAFIDMGRYQDAFNVLMGINPQSLGKGFAGAQGRAILFNNLAYTYIGLGDLESAEKVIEEMKKAIDDPKLKNIDKIKNQLFDMYTSKKMIVQIERGDFEGAEQIFLMLLEKADSNIFQVCIGYYLARVYLNSGNPEKAKRYMDFVMQYGGDTVYKTKLQNL